LIVHSQRRDYDAEFAAATRARNNATKEAAEQLFRPKDRRPTIEARVKVRFFDSGRAYGFAENLAGGPDVFVHARVLNGLGEIARGTVMTVLLRDEPGKSSVVEQILTIAER
jgi:cold shock CspA family protein